MMAARQHPLFLLSGVAGDRVAREDAGALCHRTIVPGHVLHHLVRQKNNVTAINANIYPDGCNCRRLLFPLHQNLHLTWRVDNSSPEVKNEWKTSYR
jgi:hypothetical protein